MIFARFANEGVDSLTNDECVCGGSVCQALQPESFETRPIVYLLGATFGTANLGVSALTVGAVNVVMHRWPQARIFVLDYGTPIAPMPSISTANALK